MVRSAMSQESTLLSSIFRCSLHPIFGPASQPYSLPCPRDTKPFQTAPLPPQKGGRMVVCGGGGHWGERDPSCSSQTESAPAVSAPGLAFHVAHGIPEHLQVLGGSLAASGPLPLGAQFQSLLLC